ncbi:hypothetical protein Tco_0373275 [Tanacetum coccineum]
MSGSQDEIPPPPPPPPSSSQTPTQQTPHTVSTIKLAIIKSVIYDIWAMKMEALFGPILFNKNIWGGYTNGNGHCFNQYRYIRYKLSFASLELAEENCSQRKRVKSMDPPGLWPYQKINLISSNKMLMQMIDVVMPSNTRFEGTHKGYDRFQSLLSQLGFIVIGVENLCYDDLYNNLESLRVYLKRLYCIHLPLAHQNEEGCVEFWKQGLGRENGRRRILKALVTINGEGVDWTNHSEDEDYALMACNSSDSDTEREQLSDASIEIKAYSQGLKKVESQYDGILSYENEVLQSVFMNKESEIENQPLYDRFVTAEGMHAVPPPMTGNYMPSGPDVEIDDSKFTYGPKQTQPSESESQSSEFDTCESNISAEPSELVSEPVVNESNVECQPKVWSDAPIIEEYESDSEDECVSIPTKQQETPSFANKQVKTPRETVKNQYTHSQKPKVDKKDLGHGFTAHDWEKASTVALNIKYFNGGHVAFGIVRVYYHWVLVTKPHNKTPYELLTGKGPTWLFDLDYLTDSMNYHPISSENQANHHAGQQEANQNAGTEDIIEAGDSEQEDESAQDCFVLPIWPSYSSTITPDLKTDEKRDGPREEEQVFMDELERLQRQEKEANEEAEALRKKFEHLVIKEGAARPSSTNIFSTVSTPAKASSTNLVNTVSMLVSTASPHEGLSLSDPTNPEEDDSEIPPLEDIY